MTDIDAQPMLCQLHNDSMHKILAHSLRCHYWCHQGIDRPAGSLYMDKEAQLKLAAEVGDALFVLLKAVVGFRDIFLL